MPIQEHIFFVSTTKLEKIQQMNAIAQQKHYPALFLPITALGTPAPSPEEDEETFEGNMMKKCATAADFLNGYTKNKTVQALTTLGFSNVEERLKSGNLKLYGVAEDSGISFDTKIRTKGDRPKDARDFTDIFFDTSDKGPYTNNVDKELIESLNYFRNKENGKYDPFPGTETIRVFGGAGGIENFFRLINIAVEKAGLTIDPAKAKEEGKKWLQLHSNSVIGSFPWMPGERIDTRPFSIKPESLLEKTEIKNANAWILYKGTAPDVSANRERTLDRHVIPRSKAQNNKFVSSDELGELFQPEARSRALKAIMQEFSVNKVKPEEWKQYTQERDNSLKVQLFDQAYRVALTPDDGGYLAAIKRKTLSAQCKKENMHLWMPEAQSHDVKTHAPAISATLDSYEQMIRGNDAFVLMPDPSNTLDVQRKLDKYLNLTTIALHKQLDPEGKGKTIVMYNDDGSWDDIYHQLVTMFNRGAFGDRPSKVIHMARSQEEVIEILKKAHAEYRPVKVGPETELPIKDVKEATGKYNVCVFLSASLEGIYQEKARYLGRRLQEEGMALVYGAADRNMMGGLVEGAKDYRNETGNDITIAGSSTTNILTQETNTGGKPEIIPDAFYYHAATITARKKFLFHNSHAFVCLEGGVGTLDELLTWMWYKKHDPEMVKDKPMIISESAYSENPIFHKVVDMYLGTDYAKLNYDERKEKFKKEGIIILTPPEKLPLVAQGEPKKLYEIEMDNVIDLLKEHRLEHWPDLDANDNRNMRPAVGASAAR